MDQINTNLVYFDKQQLQILLKNNLYCDITLVLDDGKKPIIQPFHKLILGVSSEYFRKLFTGFKEENSKQITIQVNNSDVALNILLSLYGFDNKVNKWQDIFDEIKCREFFLLPYDISIIENIKVEPIEFDNLLDKIELYGYNDNSIKCILNNIPKDYEITKFPKELFDEIQRLGNKLCMAVVCNDGIVRIFEEEKNKFVTRSSIGNDKLNKQIFSCAISPDSTKIVLSTSNNYLQIWDTETKELICEKLFEYSIFSLTYSPNGKQIALRISHYGGIKILNSETFDILYDDNLETNIDHSKMHYDLAYSGDSKLLIYSLDNQILFIDCLNMKLTYARKCVFQTQNQRVLSISFSKNNYVLFGTSQAYVIVWDILNQEEIKILSYHGNSVIYVTYSFDETKIISCDIGGRINIFDAQTYELLHCKQIITIIQCVTYFADTNQLAIGTSYCVQIFDVDTLKNIETIKLNNIIDIKFYSYNRFSIK